jgi:pimeloyl-ACP methyl ester carboxylesterase
MATLRLGDGRVLSYHLNGAPDGAPVFFVHGLSDSGQLRHWDDAFTAAEGVRLIGIDLPGVGLSSPYPGHTLLDWARDAIALADALGLDTFTVAGHSGGGPHALALAHLLPQRVRRLVLLAAPAPLDEPGLEAYVLSREVRMVAQLYRWRLYPLIKWSLKRLSRQAARDLDRFVGVTALNYPHDHEVFLSVPEQARIWKASLGDGMGQGGEGIYEIAHALCGPWGFRPEDVHQPVTIFYGDEDDIFAPELPLRLAARLPNAEARLWSGGGHYDFARRERWADFLKAVRG